ncbi:MAG TPA: DNA mismatch repair endonuclease MutL [Patescibacteria group bacterium]
MATIKHLPSHIVNAIAAGEVVERPASVIKELVENSIDAGASFVKIALTNAGIDRIVITDNGHGMDQDDLPLSFQPHATSKISQFEDLENIRTLGFRGEALASIVSAAKVIIQSKPAHLTSGYQITIDGEAGELQPVGMPYGTTIIVEELFRHLPARKKFLKSAPAELQQVLTTVTQLALAHPHVGMMLTNDQKIKIDLPENQSLAERVFSLYGHDWATNSYEMNVDAPAFSLSGILGSPVTSLPTKNQVLIVNQRPVRHPKLAQALTAAYTNLPRNRFPFFVVHLTIDPQLYDVHIHPRKETVRFNDEATLLAHIRRVVSDQLKAAPSSYHVSQHSALTLGEQAFSYAYPLTHKASDLTSQLLKAHLETWTTKTSPPQISQIHHTYISIPTDQGLILIDQHAAHERILYEQFLSSYHQLQAQSHRQPLDQALLIELPPAQATLLEQQMPLLAELGFEIEAFDDSTFKIVAVPSLLADRNLKRLFDELLADLDANPLRSAIDDVALRTIAYLACRSAIMAGDPLSLADMTGLIEKLEQTPHNGTCPHGRPTKIIISLTELEKMFGRK